MLLKNFNELLQEGWKDVFAQKRTLDRAIEHAIGMICAFGRRTISRTICAIGRQHQDWSADYKIYSRSPWEKDELYDSVIEEYLKSFPEGPIPVAFDDTKLKKSGKKIKDASWQRDPMSPPFHVNFIWSLRIAHAALLFPLYQIGNFDCRGIPVRFWDAPVIKKPDKKASQEQIKEYRKQKKIHNLTNCFLDQMINIRKNLDDMGASKRTMIAAVDGSLCNKTIFKSQQERIEIVARCRKDTKLCFHAPSGSRKKFGDLKFQPQEVRKDDSIPWEKAEIFFGGALREIKYKELPNVLWQRGAGKKELRLIVIAPRPYQLSPNSKKNYRDPAYLLSTDVKNSVVSLIQTYFDRWQIEINHREIKDILGVGHAQVWSNYSVPRQPAFAVSVYSLLMLAGLKAYGPARTADYVPLPLWRKKARRPSALDLVTVIRKEINEMQNSTWIGEKIKENTAIYAYA